MWPGLVCLLAHIGLLQPHVNNSLGTYGDIETTLGEVRGLASQLVAQWEPAPTPNRLCMSVTPPYFSRCCRPACILTNTQENVCEGEEVGEIHAQNEF